MVSLMAKKRMSKWIGLSFALMDYPAVYVGGKTDAPTALLCWGSVRGACEEVAVALGLRLVQPVVLHPFPAAQMTGAFTGVTRIISVEENADGQLATLAREHGIEAHGDILKYDGRPFTPSELLVRVEEVMAR